MNNGKDIKNIYFLGDSITYGHDDLIYGGYVNQVRNELDENKFNIVNCGVSGDRVIDLINRLDYIFNKERNNNSELVFIFIGINDTNLGLSEVISQNELNFRLKHFYIDYKELINLLINVYQVKKENIVILTLINIDKDEIYNNYGQYFDNKVIEKFNDVILKVKDEYNLNIINLFNILKKEDFFDGLHPNYNGHKIIKDLILKYIKKEY